MKSPIARRNAVSTLRIPPKTFFDRAQRGIVVPEFIFGCVILFDTGRLIFFSVPGGFSEIAGVGLACLAVIRIKINVPAASHWFQWILGAMAVSVLFTILINGSFVISRMGHLIAWGLVAWGIGVGRIHLPSLARGLAIGVVLGSLYGLVFLGKSNYAGRLTGIFGDPNTAGLYILVGGFMAMAFTRTIWRRRALGGIIIGAVWLTGSRTSLFAIAIVIIWVVVLSRIPRLISLIMIGAVILWFALSNSVDFAVGAFSDRSGSDVLRQTIVELEHAKFGSGSFFGQGLGEGFVILPSGQMFFFHSSYLSSLVEFGWVTTALVIAIFIVALIKSAHMVPTREVVLIEAAILSVAICAVNLGEVFYTIPAAVALGALVHFVTFRDNCPRIASRRG